MYCVELNMEIHERLNFFHPMGPQCTLFHEFAPTYSTYTQIEQIVRIFGVLLWGRAQSSEYNPSPENSPSLIWDESS